MLFAVWTKYSFDGAKNGCIFNSVLATLNEFVSVLKWNIVLD
jgi:hypothetical protein